MAAPPRHAVFCPARAATRPRMAALERPGRRGKRRRLSGPLQLAPVEKGVPRPGPRRPPMTGASPSAVI